MARTRRELLGATVQRGPIARRVAPRKAGRPLAPLKPSSLPLVSPLPAPDFLELLCSRCSYGLTQAEYLEASSMGAGAWLQQQMLLSGLDDTALEQEIEASYPRVNWSVTELIAEARQRSDGGGLAARDHLRATLLRRIKSKRQLFEVMVEFWSDHFNIDNGSFPLRVYKIIDDREVIRAHALGNFKAMLRASAHSPAMLVYLENFNNVVGVAQENYARELMELHTLGIDGGYTEDDVKAVARCFTGWSIRSLTPDTPQFYFYPGRHDTGEKLFLQNTVAAGGGIGDGDRVLSILADHPSTARHVARKLCAYFIGDDPEPAVVERVAMAYQTDNGDIKSMLGSIFGSDEFAASHDRKVRRPGNLIPASLRVTGASLTGDYMSSLQSRLKLLGHLPFQWLAPDGYPQGNDYWVNTGSSLNRWNWMLALAEGRANAGITLDMPSLYGNATTPTQLVDTLAPRLLRRELAADDRNSLVTFAANGGDANAVLNASQLLLRTKELVGLILCSAYFQYR